MKIDSDEAAMRLAIELAKKGEGAVEPNPMVGCVLVQNGNVIGRGWHEQFGGPHAEVNAIAAAAQDNQSTPGATAYVTLEPCSHVGKTGPCVDALIEANVARVFVAVTDPNPRVSGTGIARLKSAGIEVSVGLLEREASDVVAPYLKKMKRNLPWVIAKWAMTLDGKIATETGDSKWISCEQSRETVHQLRSRVDAVMVGIGTAIADDPMLNARPSNNTSPAAIRNATRVVVDSLGRIPLDSKLVKSARKHPCLIAVGPNCNADAINALRQASCEVFQSFQVEPNERLHKLLIHMAEQGVTNVLVEGGSRLLGSLNDLNAIDEVHIFVGPKLAGGEKANSAMAGKGNSLMGDSNQVKIRSVTQIGDDVYIVGRIDDSNK